MRPQLTYQVNRSLRIRDYRTDADLKDLNGDHWGDSSEPFRRFAWNLNKSRARFQRLPWNLYDLAVLGANQSKQSSFAWNKSEFRLPAQKHVNSIIIIIWIQAESRGHVWCLIGFIVVVDGSHSLSVAESRRFARNFIDSLVVIRVKDNRVRQMSRLAPSPGDSRFVWNRADFIISP